MPDAGDFERDHPQPRADFGWGEAFAALPQEAPDPGAWQRVQARLPAPAPRARWPLWLATAASLVVAVAIPLKMLPAPPPAIEAMPAPQAATGASTSTPTTMPAAVAVEAPAVVTNTSPPQPTPIARRDPPRRLAPAQQPIRAATPPVEATRLAASETGASGDLEPLYARSAQLEGLLALARDERVAGGTSAALTDELDARVAGIDTALIQPGLSEAQRADLWNQRVDALQQLVGIEATNRLYAARGQRHDAALVSID